MWIMWFDIWIILFFIIAAYLLPALGIIDLLDQIFPYILNISMFVIPVIFIVDAIALIRAQVKLIQKNIIAIIFCIICSFFEIVDLAWVISESIIIYKILNQEPTKHLLRVFSVPVFLLYLAIHLYKPSILLYYSSDVADYHDNYVIGRNPNQTNTQYAIKNQEESFKRILRTEIVTGTAAFFFSFDLLVYLTVYNN